jgi:hypothetical protein
MVSEQSLVAMIPQFAASVMSSSSTTLSSGGDSADVSTTQEAERVTEQG